MQSTPTSHDNSSRRSNSQNSIKSSSSSQSSQSSSSPSSSSSSSRSLESIESPQHKGLVNDDIDKLFDILKDYKDNEDEDGTDDNSRQEKLYVENQFVFTDYTVNGDYKDNDGVKSAGAGHECDDDSPFNEENNKLYDNENNVGDHLSEQEQDDVSEDPTGGVEETTDEEPVLPRQLIRNAFIEVKEHLYVTAKLFSIGAVTFYYELMSEIDSITLRIGDVDDKKGYFFCTGYVDNDKKDVRLFFINKTMDKPTNILLKNYLKSSSVRNSLKQNGHKLQQLIQSKIMMDHLTKFAESINASPMKIRQTLNHSSYTESLRGHQGDERLASKAATPRASKSNQKGRKAKRAQKNTTKAKESKSQEVQKVKRTRKRKSDFIEDIDYPDNFDYHDFSGGHVSPLVNGSNVSKSKNYSASNNCDQTTNKSSNNMNSNNCSNTNINDEITDNSNNYNYSNATNKRNNKNVSDQTTHNYSNNNTYYYSNANVKDQATINNITNKSNSDYSNIKGDDLTQKNINEAYYQGNDDSNELFLTKT